MSETDVRRRGFGEDGIYLDAARNRYMGAISLGYGPDGKCIRRKVSGKTKQEVRAKYTSFVLVGVSAQSSAVGLLTLRNFYGPYPRASSGAVGMCARPGGWAVVQRFVHDMASLQYHRMSAHAGLPSGTKRPSGSAMPHKEHWAASNGRDRLRCVAVGGFVGAGSVIAG